MWKQEQSVKFHDTVHKFVELIPNAGPLPSRQINQKFLRHHQQNSCVAPATKKEHAVDLSMFNMKYTDFNKSRTVATA